MVKHKTLKERFNFIVNIVALFSLTVLLWLLFARVRDWIGNSNTSLMLIIALVMFFLATGYLSVDKIWERIS